MAQTREAGWQEKRAGRFGLRYMAANPDMAEAESALTGAQTRVETFFGKIPPETVAVVYPDVKSLEKAVKMDLPDWSIGFAVGPIMAITSPTSWSAWTLEGSTVEQIWAHEFTHVVVNQLGGARVPKWLNEGIAPPWRVSLRRPLDLA